MKYSLKRQPKRFFEVKFKETDFCYKILTQEKREKEMKIRIIEN